MLSLDLKMRELAQQAKVFYTESERLVIPINAIYVEPKAGDRWHGRVDHRVYHVNVQTIGMDKYYLVSYEMYQLVKEWLEEEVRDGTRRNLGKFTKRQTTELSHAGAEKLYPLGTDEPQRDLSALRPGVPRPRGPQV